MVAEIAEISEIDIVCKTLLNTILLSELKNRQEIIVDPYNKKRERYNLFYIKSF